MTNHNSTVHSPQVFFASCGANEALTLWHVVEGEVRLPWVKFTLPPAPVPADPGTAAVKKSGYRVLDGALGRGMRKLVAATDRGRLLIYQACLKKQAELAQMENVAIVKVAHEVG